VCLAHDLGHTPFGHAGQQALNVCMKEHGGFEHNLQSLRVVDVLEHRYADYPGLNLTYETREGILKHCSRYEAQKLGELGQRFVHKLQPGLESQIANIADEIAYNNHDVDDGLRAELISMDELRECEIIEEHYQSTMDRWPGIHGRLLSNGLIRGMINSLVTNLIETSNARIESADFQSIEDVRIAGEATIMLDEHMQRKHMQLKRFLNNNLYNHDKVRSMAEKSRHIVIKLFEAYVSRPELLPDNARGNEVDSKECMIKDYIAGMTDRFAIVEYERIMSL
jgi:dGTPase